MCVFVRIFLFVLFHRLFSHRNAVIAVWHTTGMVVTKERDVVQGVFWYKTLDYPIDFDRMLSLLLFYHFPFHIQKEIFSPTVFNL